MPIRLLFICTHNRCRSILAEAITNSLSEENSLSKTSILAASAGSSPVDQIHPLTIKHLKELGIKTDKLKSQSWNEFENFAPDAVITLCDSAAAEPCPAWFNKNTLINVHWGLADPSKIIDNEKNAYAFKRTINSIEVRINQLLLFLDSAFDQQSIAKELRRLAASE